MLSNRCAAVLSIANTGNKQGRFHSTNFSEGLAPPPVSFVLCGCFVFGLYMFCCLLSYLVSMCAYRVMALSLGLGGGLIRHRARAGDRARDFMKI